MKVRTSFISNSSSTSYIVVVPPEFRFEVAMISVINGFVSVEEMENHGFANDDEGEMYCKIEDMIEEIAQNTIVYRVDNWEVVYYTTAELIQQLGMCIKEFDDGPDRGSIFNVVSPEVNDFIKSVKKGGLNATSGKNPGVQFGFSDRRWFFDKMGKDPK